MSTPALPRLPALLTGAPAPKRSLPTWPVFGATDEQRVLRALRSGQWGKLSGTEVAEFEKRFAALHGAKFGIGIVNGTVSLRLALMAADIKEEDEVIVPSYTFLASATAVVEANAIPVFADIELDTFNLDPKAVLAAITPRTRAIIVVHLGGLPAEMDAIMAIARMHNLTVIEDAAHAHAAIYKTRPVGSIGHLGSFSFQSTKNLTSGEGGIITTNDPALAEACVSLHNCGRRKAGLWYEHHIISANYRLGELQGALLNAQLDRLEAQTNLRNANGKYLDSRLAQIPGLHPQKRDAACTRHAYHLYPFRIDAEKFGLPRDIVLRALDAEGVPASGGYPLPLYRQPLFLNKAFGPYLNGALARLDYSKVKNSNCETICYQQGAWFDQANFLGTTADMDAIADAFERIYEHRVVLRDWTADNPST
jgi:dTDP-4-amino-4,6-dideoxygalactose transaminase